MRLYLTRHGQAEPFAASDMARPLTGQGEREVDLLWAGLYPDLAAPTAIISSPYLRAVQTAERVAACCGLPGIAARQPLLSPDTSPDRVIDWLVREMDDGLLLATHMPLIALLTSALAGESGERLAFATGAVVALEMDVVARDAATLVWLKAPGEAL